MKRTVLLIALSTLGWVVSCTEEKVRPEPVLPLVQGSIIGDYEGVSIFEISDKDFASSVESYNQARQRADGLATGFWWTFFDMNIGRNFLAPVRHRTFQNRVPAGTYLIVCLDKGDGRFLPVRVVGNLTIDFDAQSAFMSSSE